MKFGCIAFLCVLVTSWVDADTEDYCHLSPIENCRFYNFISDIVTPEQMSSQNVMGVRWIMIYYSQYNKHRSLGKCNFRWHEPDSNNIIRRELMCYNIDRKSCESFEYRVKQKEDICGRVEENGYQVMMDAKFYSQDLSQYFWYKVCYSYAAPGICDEGNLNLLVREIRDQGDELDLQGLPWHLISADLKNNFNMDISDEKMKFSWKGPECGFEGTIKTNSAAQRAGNYFAFLFTLASILLL